MKDVEYKQFMEILKRYDENNKDNWNGTTVQELLDFIDKLLRDQLFRIEVAAEGMESIYHKEIDQDFGVNHYYKAGFRHCLARYNDEIRHQLSKVGFKKDV